MASEPGLNGDRPHLLTPAELAELPEPERLPAAVARALVVAAWYRGDEPSQVERKLRRLAELRASENAERERAAAASPLPGRRCPWCGTRIRARSSTCSQCADLERDYQQLGNR